MVAFISALPTVASPASSIHGTSHVCRIRPVTSRPFSRASPPVAAVQTPEPQTNTKRFNKLEENRQAKATAAQSVEQDYFPEAEKLNGRAAMIGFVIGLVTEAVSGQGILEQVHTIFSPLL